MAVEHRNIPEDGLHEPKGISAAASNRVYISDGTGTGAWSLVDANAIKGTINNTQEAGLRLVTDGSGGFSAEAVPESYGAMVLTSNTTTVASTAAADPTLASNTDYTELSLAFVFENLAGLANGSNFLSVTEAGVYSVDFWANVKSDVNATTFALKFVVNDLDFVDRRPKKRLPNAGTLDNMSANGIHPFTAGDEVKLYIATSTTCNITIEDMSFTLRMLEATG